MASEEHLGFCVTNESINEITEKLIEVLLKNSDRQKQAENLNKYNWVWCAKKVMDIVENG
jgi:hypothetical protein